MSNYNDKYDDYADNEVHTPRRRRRSSERLSEKSSERQVGNKERQRRKKRKRRMSPAKKFLTIVLAVLGVYIVALGIFTLAAYLSDDPNDKPLDILTSVVGGKVPERTNFVIMCTDEEGTRTDTIMVGCYNSVTNGIDIMSIPRDTLVSATAANYEIMQERNPGLSSNVMMVNSIHSYAGSEDGPEMLTEELENLLDISIDYYIRVDFDAFHYFIDSIGGVDFDVPRDMKYDDPTQDLHIDLEAGMQHLDGEKAEQLVRFRKDNYGGGYALGDIDRIQVQQDFFKALVKKAVSADTIKSNPQAYLTTLFKYVTTNAGIKDTLKYVSVIDKLDTDNINTYTLPGTTRNNRWIMDEEQTESIVYEVFKRPSDEILAEQEAETNGTAPTDSKSASIQVLNGGYTNGKASEVQDMLSEAGYTVADIGTYEGDKEEATRIYVNQNGLGEDLTEYFTNAEVIKDSSVTGDYDIVIVVGTDE